MTPSKKKDTGDKSGNTSENISEGCSSGSPAEGVSERVEGTDASGSDTSETGATGGSAKRSSSGPSSTGSSSSSSRTSSSSNLSSFDFGAFRRELINMFATSRETESEAATLTLESIINIVRTAAVIGGESFKAALDMISEFIKETTGVDSVKVTPSVAPQLDVEILCRREADIPIGKKVAPGVELSSIKLGKKIHFQALLNKHEKGIQVNIKDGLEMTFSLGAFFGKQTVPVKGSAMLARNTNGEVCLVTQVVAPGTDTPVTMRMPLRKVFDHARKTWMSG